MAGLDLNNWFQRNDKKGLASYRLRDLMSCGALRQSRTDDRDFQGGGSWIWSCLRQKLNAVWLINQFRPNWMFQINTRQIRFCFVWNVRVYNAEGDLDSNSWVQPFSSVSQSNNLTEQSYPAGQNPGWGFIVGLSGPKIFANVQRFGSLISTLHTQGFNKSHICSHLLMHTSILVFRDI